ncbi:hypothetical protein [Streptosporangium carneum]|uniref:hypothetical protein n=1 Tax=Streptosporangium carneum TaxID=47481 RepID=UPI0022F31345|nr:hypothetical protein [Streptosporangium carneum]
MFTAQGAARFVAGIVSFSFAGFVLAGAPGAARAGTAEGEEAEGRRHGADLSVRLESSPAIAQPGQPLTYRVEVHNAGPEDAVLPLLVVRLPHGVDILGVNVAECLPGRAAGEVVCASQRDVLAGTDGGVTINGIVRSGARGPLVATATLSSEVVDSQEENNSAWLTTPVDEGADLAVRLSRKTRAGRLVTMDAVVRNRGPRVVRDAAVFLRTVKARFLSAKGARCHSYGGYVGCALRAVGSGRQVSLRLAFRAHRRAPRAKATVYSTHVGDRRPANNMARISLR